MSSIRRRAYQSVLLIAALLSQFILFPRPAKAQRLDVTVGQPNIWPLEQAHYLLAQIRERNMGIRNPILSDADLVPLTPRGSTHCKPFEIGVSYDQRLGLTNSRTMRISDQPGAAAPISFRMLLRKLDSVPLVMAWQTEWVRGIVVTRCLQRAHWEFIGKYWA
jgi:hypothetical protein